MIVTRRSHWKLRFWAKVRKDGRIHPTLGQCWRWVASKLKAGYGQCSMGGKVHTAQRVSWTIHFGAIPEGKCVLHRCDNPECIRPDHLFLGTHADNTADKVSKGRHDWVPHIGQNNGNSKLVDKDVMEIRRRYRSRHPRNGKAALAREFKVSTMMIHYIIIRRNWKHI